MKDFASVGRRLRRFRLLAFLPAAFGIFLCVVGGAEYHDHGPPTRWVQDHNNQDWIGMHSVAIPPDDPEYQSVLRARDSQLLFFLLWGAGFLSLGALLYGLSRRPPSKEILHLAQVRGGLLTLPEVSTTLDIDPSLAAAALRQLQKLHIATPRWQEVRKNLWEFPDYMTLPISESIDLAKENGGRITTEHLVAAGYSADTARKTLDTLNEKRLAQQDPASPAPALIVTTQ